MISFFISLTDTFSSVERGWLLTYSWFLYELHFKHVSLLNVQAKFLLFPRTGMFFLTATTPLHRIGIEWEDSSGHTSNPPKQNKKQIQHNSKKPTKQNNKTKQTHNTLLFFQTAMGNIICALLVAAEHFSFKIFLLATPLRSRLLYEHTLEAEEKQNAFTFLWSFPAWFL